MLKSGENPLKSQDNEKWKGNMKTKIFSNYNFNGFIDTIEKSACFLMAIIVF